MHRYGKFHIVLSVAYITAKIVIMAKIEHVNILVSLLLLI